MIAVATSSETFPSVRLPSSAGGVPVEATLIAQIGIGAGSQLIARSAALQRGHSAYIDALDEPSARIGDSDFAHGDATSLYSFVVGPHGHPFHCHAGHRVFTAISGSAGCRLRFSTATPDAIRAEPQRFFDALRHIDIPPDCLFTVRFGGGTWHQFLSADPASGHPALFALSCHTDELGGTLSAEQRARVLAGQADIPSLTELLPETVAAMLADGHAERRGVPTVMLSLVAPRASLRGRACAGLRTALGRVRRVFGRLRPAVGFRSEHTGRAVTPLAAPPRGSLLLRQFAHEPRPFDPAHEHQDGFALEVDEATLAAVGLRDASASALLAALLDGFLHNRPAGVSRLMRLRNVLVLPLGLRTSPLGCPVSSLLGQAPQTFAGRFPVLAQAVDEDGRSAQVVLGADDKHLRFRSCAMVERIDGGVRFSLATRVRTRNLFGDIYMRLIDRTHRAYVAPAMLQLAVAYALRAQAAAPVTRPRWMPVTA